MPEQVEEPKEIYGVKQALSEEKALTINAMRFHCMPFLLSRPNSTF